MKIAYVIDCMYNSGGMERVLSVCANALCQDVEVSIITIYQMGRPCYFPIDDKIHRYDLGLEDVVNKKLLKKLMTDFLTGHHFDIVVSMGGIDMCYLPAIKDGSKKLFWFHFAIDVAKTAWSGPNPNLFKKIKAQLQTWKRIYYARKYDKIVVISKADLEAWKKYTNKVVCVYNPVTIDNPVQAGLNSKKVISVGRLSFEKGFDYLIDVWRLVAKRHKDWLLDIYGDGPLSEQLQGQIDKQGLRNSVRLCGRTPNIAEKYAQHSIYVMGSRTEGLGLVLLEASACGLPLISYDCPSGPREIVTDGENGYLIPHVGDIDAMAEKICLLIEDAELRKQMGEKAKLMVDKFSPLKIKEQWMTLFDNICKK